MYSLQHGEVEPATEAEAEKPAKLSIEQQNLLRRSVPSAHMLNRDRDRPSIIMANSNYYNGPRGSLMPSVHHFNTPAISGIAEVDTAVPSPASPKSEIDDVFDGGDTTPERGNTPVPKARVTPPTESRFPKPQAEQRHISIQSEHVEEEEGQTTTSTQQLINSRVSARMNQLAENTDEDADLSVESDEPPTAKASVLKVDELDQVQHRVSSSRGSSMMKRSSGVKISERVSTKTFNTDEGEEQEERRSSSKRMSSKRGPVMKKVVYYSETGSVLAEDTEFVGVDAEKKSQKKKPRAATGFNHSFNKHELDTSASLASESSSNSKYRQNQKDDSLVTKISKVIDEKLDSR